MAERVEWFKAAIDPSTSDAEKGERVSITAVRLQCNERAALEWIMRDGCNVLFCAGVRHSGFLLDQREPRLPPYSAARAVQWPAVLAWCGGLCGSTPVAGASQ